MLIGEGDRYALKKKEDLENPSDVVPGKTSDVVPLEEEIRKLETSSR